MKAGIYLNQNGNLAIVYPDQSTEVWVDTNDQVYFNDDKWMKFKMNETYASFFKWEFLCPL